MRALTLHQPWATLVAVGAKRIETRPWATKYRGPVAIHAGANQRYVGINWDSQYGPALHECGENWQRLVSRTLRHAGYEPGSISHDPHPFRDGEFNSMPISAVVATATLVGVVPTEDLEWKTDEWVQAADTIGSELLKRSWLSWEWNGQPFATAVHEAQRPFGDFTPGRYAWLIADVERLPEPISAKGHQGLWTWEPVPA